MQGWGGSSRLRGAAEKDAQATNCSPESLDLQTQGAALPANRCRTAAARRCKGEGGPRGGAGTRAILWHACVAGACPSRKCDGDCDTSAIQERRLPRTAGRPGRHLQHNRVACQGLDQSRRGELERDSEDPWEETPTKSHPATPSRRPPRPRSRFLRSLLGSCSAPATAAPSAARAQGAAQSLPVSASKTPEWAQRTSPPPRGMQAWHTWSSLCWFGPSAWCLDGW